MQKIPTGCRAIDEFLKGGFPAGNVVLVYGEAETGKTTLAMQCAINCVRLGYKALYVDSDRTFSARRFSQIAGEQFQMTIAEMIILIRPDNLEEQAAIVDQLNDYVNRNFKLVVFDTVTSLYRLKISESPSKTFELNRELNRQLAALAQMARTQKVTILLTSQVHSVLDKASITIEPVATRVLKFWADTVVDMKLTQNPQIVTATVEKNTERLSPVSCDLRIEETGLHVK